MNCSLEKVTKREHSVADTRYLHNFINCPLINGRQICFWCCLHIRDIADPLNRGDYLLTHPEYAEVLPKESGMDWDSMWSVCSKCSR